MSGGVIGGREARAPFVPAGMDAGAGAGGWGPGAKKRFRADREICPEPEERQLPTLPTGMSVPSAMAGLTSLFGMGRGGAPPL